MKNIPNDHTMIQITLTLAVPNYMCDEHNTSEMAQSTATDQVIEAISSSEAMILGWESRPLTLTAEKS